MTEAKSLHGTCLSLRHQWRCLIPEGSITTRPGSANRVATASAPTIDTRIDLRYEGSPEMGLVLISPKSINPHPARLTAQRLSSASTGERPFRTHSERRSGGAPSVSQGKNTSGPAFAPLLPARYNLELTEYHDDNVSLISRREFPNSFAAVSSANLPALFYLQQVNGKRRRGAVEHRRFRKPLIFRWFLYCNRKVALQHPFWGDVSFATPCAKHSSSNALR